MPDHLTHFDPRQYPNCSKCREESARHRWSRPGADMLVDPPTEGVAGPIPMPVEMAPGRDWHGPVGQAVTDMEKSGEDHTSGTMRCRWRIVGGHVHCDIFGPYSGKAGDLVFRVEEWDHFQRTHPNWSFSESSP